MVATAKKVYRITVEHQYGQIWWKQPDREDSRGKTCLYSGSIAKYKDVSEMLGYGLNIAKMPKSVVITNSGCVRRRMERAPT